MQGYPQQLPGGLPDSTAHQMSEAMLTGACWMISGETNSGEPYLLYCNPKGVSFWAKPKSQILMSSRAGCTIKMLGGCQAKSRCQKGLCLGMTPAPGAFGF